jgi:hypothetical protein
MEGERSLIIAIMGDMSKAPLLEASPASSSSDASSGGATSDVAEAEDAMDPRELVRSYDFGASLVTVGRIQQLESLGYFAEGSTCEETVFEEFFAAGLRMPPHLALTEILLKFWVQLHQLTLNAIAQLSKYLWAVLSFRREPSSDGFAKRYELHYQPKKVAIDDFEKFQQFGITNFHAKRGSGAHSGYQEQMVSWVDKGLVLLQGTLACLSMGGIHLCSSLAQEFSDFSHEALYSRF